MCPPSLSPAAVPASAASRSTVGVLLLGAAMGWLAAVAFSASGTTRARPTPFVTGTMGAERLWQMAGGAVGAGKAAADGEFGAHSRPTTPLTRVCCSLAPARRGPWQP